MLARYTVFAIVLSVVVGVLAIPGESSPVATEQSSIIKFSHKFHSEVGAGDCATCHEGAVKSLYSSDNLLPMKEHCAACHDVQDTDQCSKCHYDDKFEKLEVAKRELIFPHAVHAGDQKMECAVCHVGVDQVDYVSKSNMPAMTACTNCHDNSQATNVCESCHTDFVTLIPADHRYSDFRRNHRLHTRLGGLEVGCQTCHSEETCQGCHQGAGIVTLGKNNAIGEPRPVRATRDVPEKMVLQKVHELNWRFTHGIEARARTHECASCHNETEFCVACHQQGGNITAAKFKPASHMVPGFTTLGRGTGGGEHARLARRDLEECVACHNVEGRDPVCMICHSETGKVR